MPERAIQVVSRSDRWAVCLSHEVQATFAAPAEAVTFAQVLADRLAPNGLPALPVRVYFGVGRLIENCQTCSAPCDPSAGARDAW